MVCLKEAETVAIECYVKRG